MKNFFYIIHNKDKVEYKKKIEAKKNTFKNEYI